MEHIPASHAAKVGMQFPGWVTLVCETELILELDLMLVAPGRLPRLRAELWFEQTVSPERARRMAPGDPVEAVLIEAYRRPGNERFFASLPAHPVWLTWNDETVRRLARHIRETGETHLLPVLADALEDAGCTDVALLNICRQSYEDVNFWAPALLATQE